MSVDVKNSYNIGLTLQSLGRKVTKAGAAVDFRDCGPDVTAVLNVGRVSGTSPTLDVKLQEADDTNESTTWSDITGAAFSQKTADHASTVDTIIVYNRSKRYVRAHATLGGTAPSFLSGCVLLSRKVSQ